MAEEGKDTSRSGALVLVVDDDPSILRVVEVQLQRNGFQVMTAADGPAALKILRDCVPAVIILDVMMPGMSGYDVCQEVKQSPRLEKVPVIFLTAKGSPQDYRTGMAAGAVMYMVKPFSPEKLLQVVQMMAGVPSS